jgi:hypothetical protein
MIKPFMLAGVMIRVSPWPLLVEHYRVCGVHGYTDVNTGSIKNIDDVERVKKEYLELRGVTVAVIEMCQTNILILLDSCSILLDSCSNWGGYTHE